jgi:hypothetical protein
MPPVGFEPTITASELLQTHALDRATTGIGYMTTNKFLFIAHLILKHDTLQDTQVTNLRQVKVALG